MKRKIFLALVLPAWLLSCSSGSEAKLIPEKATVETAAAIQDHTKTERPGKGPQTIDPKAANRKKADLKAATRALTAAYPDFIERVEGNEVIFRDGTRMAYDDGRVKDFDTLLDDSDIEDMFFVRYDASVTPTEYLHDAGRSRSEALFKKMYGNSAETVRRKLIKVPWFGKNVDFTKVNGAADSLRKVAEELAAHPELKKYLASSGTFYWRSVRGAKRQSAHSYGIAFDIAVPYSDYWLWKNKGAKETDRIRYANRFPQKIVEIFQRHGFIWGGAWYHYDTMHFEFRPEILQYSALYGQ